MLLEYGAKNFLSFNEGIEVSFRLNSNCPESISKGKNYTNVLCVKGANGSGKTNVLKILNFLDEFCCNSFSKKPDEEIECKSFFNNNEPIDFYIEFAIDKIEFRYELTLTKKNVLNETLFKKNKRSTKVLERKNNKIEYNSSEYDDVKIIKLRSNASIISTANQYEIKILEPIYKFFKSIITNIKFNFSNENIGNALISDISEIYYENQEIFNFSKDMIYKSDLGINNIEIIKNEDENNKSRYFPVFSYSLNNKNYFLTFAEQSSGTKSLFNQLWVYKNALTDGGILVLDEFDINLHSHLLPLLINLFDNESINKNDTQIIFTTHNTEIMDSLSKYRLFLVNKENNESFGYRVDEISGDMIRNERPISPIYNEGKIGGIPKI